MTGGIAAAATAAAHGIDWGAIFARAGVGLGIAASIRAAGNG